MNFNRLSNAYFTIEPNKSLDFSKELQHQFKAINSYEESLNMLEQFSTSIKKIEIKAFDINNEFPSEKYFNNVKSFSFNTYDILKENPSKNKITTSDFNSILNELIKFKKLKSLDLGKQKITNIPESINHLNLSELLLAYNPLQKIPAFIFKSKTLEGLNLKNTSKIFPSSIKSSNVKYLDISKNSLHELPSCINQMNNLISLKAHNNKLKDVSTILPHLKNLNYLDLSYNELETLPEDFNNLKKLTTIYLQHNNLISLPETFFENEIDMGRINLSSNQLRYLPSNFNILNLMKFDISNNNLFYLPSELCNFFKKKGTPLNFDNNQFMKLHSSNQSNTVLINENLKCKVVDDGYSNIFRKKYFLKLEDSEKKDIFNQFIKNKILNREKNLSELELTNLYKGPRDLNSLINAYKLSPLDALNYLVTSGMEPKKLASYRPEIKLKSEYNLII